MNQWRNKSGKSPMVSYTGPHSISLSELRLGSLAKGKELKC